MKIFYFLLLANVQLAFSQSDTIIIKKTKFLTIIRNIKNEYNKKDKILNLYRIENEKRTYLLQHYLYKYDADCNNEVIERGTFAIQNDSIIFKTQYLQEGHDPIPIRRKKIYKVDINGKLSIIYDKELYRTKGWINTNATYNTTD